MVPPSGAVLLKNKMPKKSTLEDYVFSRPAPRDENLEMALLGAMMLDRDAYFLVRDIAGPETMYSAKHRLVYEAIDRCEHDGLPIDLLTVADRLKASGVLEEAGGAYYLTELTGRVGSSANIEAHARLVREKWMLRRSIQMATDTLRMAYDGDDPFEVLAMVDSSVMEISNFKASGTTTLLEATKKLNEAALARRESGTAMVGYRLFGIEPLDNALDGAADGDVINISGRPGQGKTSLVTSILRKCAEDSRKAFFWTSEATTEKIAAKVASHEIGIPVRDIELGKHLSDPNDSELIINKFHQHIHLDTGEMDIPSMKRRVKNEYRLNGTKLFIFDRAELFAEAMGSDPGKMGSVLGDISRAMRVLTSQLEGAIFVLLSQLTKEADGVEPRMGHVYGGTLIQANCTKMIAVFQPAKHGQAELASGAPSKGMGQVHILKNNYGSSGGPIELHFNGELQKWYSSEASASSGMFG